MEIRCDGELPRGVTSKDLILGMIRKMGTGGAAGHASSSPERRSGLSRWRAG